MSSKEVVLSAAGVSKSYSIPRQEESHVTAVEYLLSRLRNPFRRQEKETFWALDNVSFEVRAGEILALLGSNGSGKSTLLKIISRVTEPSAGRINLFGRVGSLLEVGTGFHPELTGRENIFLNGTLLGMKRKEVIRQFDAIVSFAGVEKFIEMPVKRYSSGMYTRLAFSVAAHLDSELLLVDEVLAVGDAEFQRQCLNRLKEAAKGGRGIIFVSHHAGYITQLCDRAIILKNGRVSFSGTVTTALNRMGAQAGSLQTVAARARGD